MYLSRCTDQLCPRIGNFIEAPFSNFNPKTVHKIFLVTSSLIGLAGAAALILGVGSLGGIHGWWQIGLITHIGQVNSIILMSVGSTGFILSLVAFVKIYINKKSSSNVQTDSNSGVQIDPSILEFRLEAQKGQIRGERVFGVDEWATYFNVTVDDAPSLPENFHDILEESCPYAQDPNIKIKDTHMAVLMPQKLDGELFSIKMFEEMLLSLPEDKRIPFDTRDFSESIRPFPHKKIQYQCDRPYWVLFPKHLIPNTRNKACTYQYLQFDGRELPKALEVIVCIAAEYVFSGECIFGKNTSTWTIDHVGPGYNPRFDSIDVGNFHSGQLLVTVSGSVPNDLIGFTLIKRMNWNKSFTVD